MKSGPTRVLRRAENLPADVRPEKYRERHGKSCINERNDGNPVARLLIALPQQKNRNELEQARRNQQPDVNLNRLQPETPRTSCDVIATQRQTPQSPQHKRKEGHHYADSQAHQPLKWSRLARFYFRFWHQGMSLDVHLGATLLQSVNGTGRPLRTTDGIT